MSHKRTLIREGRGLSKIIDPAALVEKIMPSKSRKGGTYVFSHRQVRQLLLHGEKCLLLMN